MNVRTYPVNTIHDDELQFFEERMEKGYICEKSHMYSDLPHSKM